MQITRRHFSRLAAALPFSGVAAASAVRDVDVVIVGAGAAGIAAAGTLIKGGRSVQVIEASPRIGGRCYTDTATFGVPFDRGAARLKGGASNPLAGLARLYRFDIGESDDRELTFARNDRRPLPSNTAYERALDLVSETLAHAAEEADDRAASEIMPSPVDGEIRAWTAAASAAVGPLDMGVDLENLSIKDWFQREEDETRRQVRQGLGTLIGRLAFDVPVEVNAAARRISVARRGVSVETDRGLLRAKAAIVTVSVGVLASEAIGFDPAPDAAMLGALNGLQMGLLHKIALQFAPGSPAIAFAADSVLIPQVRDERGHTFHVRPHDTTLAICSVGGSLAEDLATQSEATNIDFARDRLRALLGSGADRGFRKGSSTDWGTNPLTRGAAAAARPGQSRTRLALETPLGERVFFAGEAQGMRAVQTVHGAYQSGERAARRVLRLLKA